MTRPELWTLVDPRLTDPRVLDVMESLRAVVAAEWDLDVEIDLRAPRTRRYLSDHRLWSLIPVDAVREGVRAELRNRQLAISAAQLRLRATATAALEPLNRAGIDTRVLKGLATGELDYPEHTRRHTGDVDLAVHPDAFDEARRILRRAGHKEVSERFSPFLKYGVLLKAENGAEIDLHTRLSRRSPHDDRLFREAGVPLSMLPGQALPVEQRMVHAAGHFLISPPGTRRLSGLFDVSLMHTRHDVDLDAARRFAADIGVESLVGAGIWVEAMLNERTDVLAALERWRAPDWLERNTRMVPERRLLLDHLGRYREVPPGQRLRYLPAWLLPSRSQRDLLARSARRTAARLLRRS